METILLNEFKKSLATRSNSNYNAFVLLLENQMYDQAISIMRSELDSFVRVMYLLEHGERKYAFIKQTFSMELWKDKQGLVTDKKLLSNKSLFGWERLIYDFGCYFLHLSYYHGLEYNKMVDTWGTKTKTQVRTYLYQYHGYKIENFYIPDNYNFDDIIFILPDVMKKITGNLKFFIEKL